MNSFVDNKEAFTINEDAGGDKYFSKCQVDTPDQIVQLAWKLTHQIKALYPKVIDFGAGDGRFAYHGNYENYLGIEFDELRIPKTKLSQKAEVVRGCAFSYSSADNDLCIGNPPFVRHHDVDKSWYTRICRQLSE